MQGNRVKESCRSDKAGKEVVVPRGDFSLEAQAVLSGRPADQVEAMCLMVVWRGRDQYARGTRRRGRSCPGPSGGGQRHQLAQTRAAILGLLSSTGDWA
jgi:hypothetical protein